MTKNAKKMTTMKEQFTSGLLTLLALSLIYLLILICH